MANIIDIYNTRTMLKAISLMKPANTFLRDTFFPNFETLLTETADVDYKKGKRKMAPFVAPRIGGKVMDRQGFETRTIKTPKVAPERVLTKDDISTRGMGEAVYSLRTPEDRAREMLANDLIDLDDMITRREEWMCREVLFSGKILIEGEGFEQEVDYNFTNKETLIGAARWTETTSDPIADLKRWRREIIRKTGKTPDICTMASDVVDAFKNNASVQKQLNLLNMNNVVIQPSVQAPSLTFIGKIAELGLEIYTYDEWYLDDDGEEKPMIPDGAVLIGSRGMNKRYYGGVTQMENKEFVTYEGTRIPKVWSDEKNEIKMVRMTSRPLPSPDDVDAWWVSYVK